MATTTITESGNYGFTAGAADSYIIKDGVTGVNITDNNADQAVQDNTTSNDLFVVENLTNTTVVINDYATVSGVDKNTNDDLLYIKNAGDGVKVAYFNIYTKAEAVNHQGGVDVAFVSTSANATGSVTAKNHLTINASGNYDKGAGYIDNVLAGEQKVNFNYNNLISKVRTLISKANTALGTSYTSSDDLKGTAYEAEMMALYNGTDENKSYPTYTIGDLSVNSTTGPLLTWLYPVDELEFTQVAGTNEVCITHGNVTQRLSYEEATFSYYAIDQGTYEYKKIDDTMIASAKNRAVYELAADATEHATIAGADFGGVWFKGITDMSNITYRRDNNNLIMSTNDNRQVTVTDFFADTNKVVASFRNDGSAAGGVLNDNANVEMFVNLSQFDGTYKATEYREVFEGSGVVSGLNALSDKVKLTYADVQLRRTFDGDNNGALTLTDGTNTITVNDYFGESYVARLIYDSSDPVGAGKSILSKPLDVTLADTENKYTTHEKFQETIHGKGIIAADSIGVAGTNKDRIVLDGDATFTRENNGDLHVKYGESDDITVTDFDFGGATKNINVNGTLTDANTVINVTLTDDFEYTPSAYADAISGVGSVAAADLATTGNDKLAIAGDVTYERTNGGDLHVKGTGSDITVTDFDFAEGTTNIKVNDGDTQNMVIDVKITQAGEYSASDYKEAYTIASGIAGNVIIHNLDGQKDSIKLNGVDFDDITFFHRDGRLDMAYGSTLVLLAGYDSAANKLSSITTNDGTYGFAVGNDATEFTFSTESTGNNIIIGALDGDKLNFTDIDKSKVAYARNALGDLVITTDKEGFAVTLKGFFSADVHKYAHLDTIKFSNSADDVSILNDAEINVNADSYFLGYNVVNDDATAEVGGYKESIVVTSGNLSKIDINDAVLNAISSGDITKTLDETGYHYTLALGKDKELASIIVGQLGDDTIYDSEGNDYLAGANGVDTIISTKGEDALIGGEGADYLYAKDNTSDVEIYGGEGADEINSGSGNDFIWGGSGNDEIHLNGGNNRIILSDDDFGSDTIYNATANDKLEFVLRKGGEIVQGHNFSELSFAKKGNDLEISAGSSKATISGFFTADSKVNTILTTDGEKSIKNDVVFDVVLDSEHPTFDKATSGYGDYKVAVSGTGSVTNLGANDKIATSGQTVKYMRENDGGLIVCATNDGEPTDKITVTDFNFDGAHDITVNNGTTENMILNVDLDGTATYAATSYAEIFSGVGSVTGFVNSKDGVESDGSPVLIRRNNSPDLNVDGITIKDFDFSTSNPFKIFDGNTYTQSTDYPINVRLYDVGVEPTEYQSTGYKEYIEGKGIVNLSGDNKFDLSQDAVYVDGWSGIHYTRENNGDLHFVQEDKTDITVKGFNFAGGTDFNVTDGAKTELTTNMTIDVTLTGIIGDDYHSASGYAERITTKASTAIQFAENSDKDTLVFDTTADNIEYLRDGNNLYVINKAGEDEIYTIIKGYYTSGDMSVAGQFAGVKVDTTSADTTLGALDVTEIENVSYFDSGDVATDKNETVYLVKGLKAGDIDADKLARDTQGVVKLNDNNYEYTSNVGLGTHTLDSYAMGRDGSDEIYGSDGTDWIHGGDGDDYIYGGKNGADMLAGGDGNDHIYAKDEDGNLNTTGVELYGGAGNDTLVGGAGNDYIWGGAGTNTLTGGAGADTFDFTVEGTADAPIHDTITDATSADTIAIYRKGFADLKFTQESNDLVISADANNTLTVQGYFSNADKVTKFEVGGKVYTLGWHDGAMYNEIRNTDDKTITAVSGIQNWIDGQSKDASGKTITGGDKYDMLAGTQNADTITAGANGAEIYGDAGNDTITATNSFIVGGSGTDTINVSGGNNTIMFLNTPSLNPTENDSYATGTDTVNGATSGDVLKFAYTDKSVGYSVADLSFAKDGDNLVITAKKDATHENTVILTDFFESTDNVVDTLWTTDGEKSIKDDAVFNIDLDKIEGHVFDKSAAGYTGYKVNVTGTGSVANIETGDKLNSAISNVSRSGNDLVLDTITVKDYYKTNNMADAGKYAGVSISTGEFGPTTLGDITVTRINNVSDIIGSDSNGEIIHLVKTEGVIHQNASGDFPNYDEETGEYTSNVGHGKIKIDAYAAGMGGRDAITGTDGNDWINGGDGVDFIYGGTGGKDMLAGGDGENYILAGVFGPDDSKVYNADGVEIYGGKDKDAIFVGGNDTTQNYIWAHGGDDEIHLKGGKNTIMLVEDGADATAGNDTIVGATSLDTLKFVSRNGEGEVIKGFAVSELSFAKSGDDLTITTPDASVTTIADFFKGQNVDTILTTDGEKSIKADAVINVVLDGETFDASGDYKYAISGNGSVKGLDKDKDIIKFSGTPTYTLIEIDGPAGPSANLKITCGDNESITVLDDYLQGNEPVVYAGSTVDNIANQTLNITGLNAFVTSENFKFRDVNITGTAGDDEYTGSAGNDIINGGKGDDTIFGGEGNDTLNGGEGVNQIHTGSGNDSVVATTGANTIYVDDFGHKVITSGSSDGNTFVFSKGTAVINGATAKDTIEFATFDPSKVEFVKKDDDLVIKSLVEGDNDTITIGDYFNGHAITKFVLGKTETELNLEWKQSNVDGESYLYNVITGTEDPDTIPAIEGIRNWINAAGGNDKITGGDKKDMLAGNADDDVIVASNTAEIYGGEGKDEIYALGGDSFVAGGLGDDTITVAGGNNTIAFVDTWRSADQKDFGADNVEGAVKGDVLKFSVDYGTQTGTDPQFVGYTFGELSVEKDGVDLIVYAGDNSVTLTDYFTQKEEDRVSAIQALDKDGETYTQKIRPDELTALVNKYIYAPERTYDEDKIEAVKGQIVIDKNAEGGEYKINAAEYVSETAKGITVNNKSANAGLDITGSAFNDTITTKNDVSNTIIENGGTNKITTGNADDVVIASNYSSNTINVGNGNNTVTLESTGINKVTASNGNNDVNVYAGSNTVKLGNGANEIGIAGGVNTIKTGKGANTVLITDGVNKVTTGKGKDEFIIAGGNNTIKSATGEDVYNIVDGYNTIKTGNAATKFTISDSYDIKDGDVTVATVEGDGGVNVITSGSKNDTFNIDAGVNTIKGGAGADTYTFASLDAGEKTIITDSKGNDIYDFTDVTDFAGLATITDKKGADIIKLADDSLTLFFDGTFNKKKGTFSFGKNVSLVDDIDDLNKNGIKISGRTADKVVSMMTFEEGDGYNIDALKSAVTSWFVGHDTYKSVDAVLNSGNETDINSLLNVYATGSYTPTTGA